MDYWNSLGLPSEPVSAFHWQWKKPTPKKRLKLTPEQRKARVLWRNLEYYKKNSKTEEFRAKRRAYRKKLRAAKNALRPV